MDPTQQGRIQVAVPDLGIDSNWAMPCVPFAGDNAGFLALPSIGSNVWIEFERGEIDYPIWVGAFWARPLVPGAQSGAHSSITFMTPGGAALTIDDTLNKGIELKTALGAHLSISETGITISNGQGASLTLIGPSIILNQGAFVVT